MDANRVWALMLVSLVVCFWSSGAVAAVPAHQIRDPECFQNGGRNLCIEPTPTPWVYHACEDGWTGSSSWARWCEVSGETPESGYRCVGSSPFTQLNLRPRTLAFAKLWLAPDAELASETEWGINA